MYLFFKKKTMAFEIKDLTKKEAGLGDCDSEFENNESVISDFFKHLENKA